MVDSDHLPELQQAPVHEVVVAVEFAPIPQLDAVRLVGLQSQWVGDYPGLQQQPPIAAGEMLMPFRLGEPAPVRIWAVNAHGDRLIQTQRDRLVLNWRVTEPDPPSPYPRFPQMLAELEQRWSQLADYLRRYDLPQPAPQVIEFTYVNHIDGELPLERVLTYANPLPDGLAERPGSIAVHVERDVEADGVKGRLVVDAVSPDPGPPTWQLTVTTRLMPGSADLRDAVALAHDTSKRTFYTITTPEAKRSWGVERSDAG